MFYFGLSKVFWGLSKAQSTKAKINNCDYIKVKTFCMENGIINKIKRQPIEWKKILAWRMSSGH